MSGSTGKNPYRPGAAVPPLHLAGRQREMDRFRAVLRGSPEVPANVRLTGLRGVGKSVLLKEFEDEAKHAGWLTTRHQVEPRHNTESDLTNLLAALSKQAGEGASRLARLRAAADSAAAGLRKALTVKFENVTVGLGGDGGREVDLARSLFHAVELALTTGHEGYVLMLDEAQVIRDDKDRNGEHPLSVFVATMNALQEAGLPLALVLCGLPTLQTNLLRARTYSERMFRGERIGTLAIEPAREAFLRPLDGTGVRADPDLVAAVLEEVEGYAYFLQLWGWELWEVTVDSGLDVFTTDILNAIQPQIYDRLDEDFYAGRFDSLTPALQDLLLDSARCQYPPLRTADLQRATKKSSGNTNVVLGRLADEGVIYRIQKGQYEYTAPKFHDYLQRRREALRSD